MPHRSAGLPSYRDEEQPAACGDKDDDPQKPGVSGEDDVNEGLLSGETKPSPEDASSHSRLPPFLRVRWVLLACLGSFGFIVCAFFFAPSIRELFSLTAQSLSSSSPPSTGKTPKPQGPPGSLTDLTDTWASVGESWGRPASALDVEAAQGAPYHNGSGPWHKTVIMVSLDGLRADYLDRGLTPGLLSLSRKGMRAKSMKPQFPTLTFPNHWSLMTGLHAESHGIVANDFWSPTLGKEFVYTDPLKSWDSYWWGGEPVWATAARNGLKTANLMWPGPPYLSDKTRPTYWRPFENHYRWVRKLRLIEGWLDMPISQRPQLITAYLPEIDQEGHRSGPDGKALNKVLKGLDSFCTSLFRSLDARNLTDIVDVIFVSDHGMTETSDVRLVFLDELLGPEDYAAITHKEGWPSAGLRFNDSVDTDKVLERLKAKAQEQTGFDVYTHETMPDRYHFSHNERIAPIYVVPHHGYAITDNHEYRVDMQGHYSPHGNHGYDNDEPDMQAVFVAHGPFAERLKVVRRRQLEEARAAPVAAAAGGASQEKGEKEEQEEQDRVAIIEPFENTEVFGLVAKLLGLQNLPPTNSTPGFWDQYF